MKDDLKTKLDFLEKKQNELINDIITFKDQYAGEAETDFLVQQFENASNQILKLRIRFATGNPKVEEVNKKGEMK